MAKVKKKTKVKKAVKPEPKYISIDEAREIEQYPIYLEHERTKIKLIESDLRAVKLKAELDRRDLESEKSVILEQIANERDKHNAKVSRMKDRYGKEQLSYDRETLMIGD